MKLFGLTGNMGSGKSTVAGLLGSHAGVTVFDTDSIAKAILVDPRHRSEVQKVLGDNVFIDSVLDLKKARVIFVDDAKRRALERYLHPLVWDHIISELKGLPDDAIAIVESAIMFEQGWENRFDAMIVVMADDATRLDRLKRTRGFTEEEALRRFAKQLPQSELIARADMQIDTRCDLSELASRVTVLLAELRMFITEGGYHD